MPERKFLNRSGAVSGTAAAVISIVTAAAAVGSLCAAKLTAPKNPAVITENGISSEFRTRAESLEAFVAEQTAKLHPYDVVLYTGVAEDGTFEIEVERAPYVTVIADDEEVTVRAMPGETVEAFLKRVGIYLAPTDFVSPGREHRITENCTIEITRAFPVSVAVDGHLINTTAAGISVGELLVREGISLGGYDELNFSSNDIVTQDMVVAVSRVQLDEHSKSVVIPYETVYEDDPNMKMGETEVEVAGADGIASVTITDKYIDGELVSTEETSESLTEPINEVIRRGTALNTPYSTRDGDFTLTDGIPTEYEYKLEGKVTAYYGTGSGTYSGRPLVVGSCGVDPDVIPFGSELYIVSKDGTKVYGYAVASDTGDIKGSGVLCDAYMGTTYESCLWWQAQFCDVYVLSVGDNSVSWR